LILINVLEQPVLNIRVAQPPGVTPVEKRNNPIRINNPAFFLALPPSD